MFTVQEQRIMTFLLSFITPQGQQKHKT